MRFNNTSFRLLILVVTLLFVAKGGYVTLIIPEKVTLEELVKMSDYILEVKKCDPHVTIEKIAVVPYVPWYKRLLLLIKKKTFYNKNWYHFSVEKDLFNKKGALLKGTVIAVHDPNVDLYISMSKAMVSKQPVPSPIIKSFQIFEQDIYNSNNQLIVFLRDSRKGTFAYTVENSWVYMNKMGEVLGLINKEK